MEGMPKGKERVGRGWGDANSEDEEHESCLIILCGRLVGKLSNLIPDLYIRQRDVMAEHSPTLRDRECVSLGPFRRQLTMHVL